MMPLSCSTSSRNQSTKATAPNTVVAMHQVLAVAAAAWAPAMSPATCRFLALLAKTMAGMPVARPSGMQQQARIVAMVAPTVEMIAQTMWSGTSWPPPGFAWPGWAGGGIGACGGGGAGGAGGTAAARVAPHWAQVLASATLSWPQFGQFMQSPS